MRIIICITKCKKMKLLLVVDDYLPGSIKVAARMMHDLALELIAQGNEVTVCTSDATLQVPFTFEDLEGVKVVRFKSGSIKNISKVKRAINETLLSFWAWRALKPYFKKNRHDMVVYYSPTIFFGPLILKLKALWHCKSFLILRDIFPQWVVDNGLIRKNSPIHLYFKFFEALNYRAADVIAVQSPSNLAYFEKKRKYKDKLDVLYNWSAVEGGGQSQNLYRKELGLADKMVFFYGGNIGHAQDMMNLVRLATSLKAYPIAHFLFVGKGDEVDLIKQAIRENNISNITYLPPVTQDEYQVMLAEFDIGLFSLHKDHVTHNFPGKLLGYMKHSMPILGSVNRGNDLEYVIAEAEAGFVTVNGNDVDFTKNAIRLIDSVQLRKHMGSNAYKLLGEKFSVKTAASKISGIVRR